MGNENIHKTLKELYINEIDFILGGRLGLVIRGVDIEFDNEIDLCVDESNFEKIYQLYSANCIEQPNYFESSTFKAHIAKYKINGLIIEVMVNPQKLFTNGSWMSTPDENICGFGVNDCLFKVFTLKSEFEYYSQTSREKPYRAEIAKKIQDKILSVRNPFYILHGGKFQKDENSNNRLKKHIIDTFKCKNILFCCFAADKELWNTIFESESSNLKKYSQNITTSLAHMETFEKQVGNSDCIIIVGGDTFSLMKTLENYNLKHLLLGKIVVGISAGACALSYAFYSNDESRCSLGLNLINQKVFCHYDESKIDKYKLLDSFEKQVDILCIPEYQFMIYHE